LLPFPWRYPALFPGALAGHAGRGRNILQDLLPGAITFWET